ncbi:AEL050Cp [Eremothecium gossypii ATCC 10895]|uniref:AEL050Cp n=1 Tax=Eremothecium gossypii (strain ATCC 10895 / CBS 109.51 / FGSC 9923 / NRRL Y-1056) TaxID=284811 RepID=Q757R2_EREGS|nr:AEL050Cp [Eremothecium gossypii ATCC 10895]AAS52635.1 AEL050Cp [Eremothecium gossypii ATCC 10895]AEY96940.1 FAEL050Cp [Eremothecium gossypii FDAG1]
MQSADHKAHCGGMNDQELEEAYDYNSVLDELDYMTAPGARTAWHKRWMQQARGTWYKWRTPRRLAGSQRGVELYRLDRAGEGTMLLEDEARELEGKRWGSWARTLVPLVMLAALLPVYLTILAPWIRFAKLAPTEPAASPRWNNGTHDFVGLTLLVSIDGFHPSYINNESTPFINELYSGTYAKSGVLTTPYMRPSFPSETFPNHWTLVTGRRPGHHGIVSNVFYDDTLKKEFVFVDSPQDPAFWKGGDPIWFTAQKAFGISEFSAAAHFWPGSETVYEEDDPERETRTPRYVDKYDGLESMDHKLDRIFEFIDMPLGERPGLILSYIPEVDSVGHRYGNAWTNPVLQKALRDTDDFMRRLFQGLEQRNLTSFANTVIVSDHGMAKLNWTKDVLFLEDIFSSDDVSRLERISGHVNCGVYPKDSHDVHYFHQTLKEHLKGLPYDVYLREQLPAEYELQGRYDHRLAPIWILSHPGKYIMDNRKTAPPNEIFGMHGFNNSHVDMRATFIGVGPFFGRSGVTSYLAPFDNIEVCQLLSDVIGLAEPAETDATWPWPFSHMTLKEWTNIALPYGWHEDSEYLAYRYPGSTFNKLWNHFKRPAAQEQVTTTLSSPSDHPPSSAAAPTTTLSSPSDHPPSSAAAPTTTLSSSSDHPTSSSAAPTTETTEWYSGIMDGAAHIIDDTEQLINSIMPQEVGDFVGGLVHDVLGGVEHFLDGLSSE